MLCYVASNASPGIVTRNVTMISQVLAMLVGAKLLRDRLGIAGRGFLIYVARCVTALVILMTTFGAVAVALLYAFQLPFELSSFR